MPSPASASAKPDNRVSSAISRATSAISGQAASPNANVKTENVTPWMETVLVTEDGLVPNVWKNVLRAVMEETAFTSASVRMGQNASRRPDSAFVLQGTKVATAKNHASLAILGWIVEASVFALTEPNVITSLETASVCQAIRE